MIYLDNSATTCPLPEVLATYQTVSTRYFANPSSAHGLGVEAQQLLRQARQQIATILAFQESEIYFTSSGTESNNWVLQGIVTALKEKYPTRNKILISAIEHPSIQNQVAHLTKRGFQVLQCPVDSDGQLQLEWFETQLGEDVLLVSTMAVNNEVGTVQPLEQLSELLVAYPSIVWHVDAVQAITCELELLQQLRRMDVCTLSSHKFHAPRGVGILAKRQSIVAQPLLYGGGQEFGLRSSTENLAGIVATAKALRMVQQEQVHTRQKLAHYRQKIVAQLETLGWQVFGGERVSAHIICASLAGVPSEVMMNALGAHQIYVSTTSACSSRAKSAHHTLGAMGVEPNLAKSAIRLSMAMTTTEQEIEKTMMILAQVTKQFEKTRGKA